MESTGLVQALRKSQMFFNNATACLTEDDADFAPRPGMMNVVQQIGHAAQSIEWLAQGAFQPEGFDTNFDRFAPIDANSTLADARARLDRAYDDACVAFGGESAESLMTPLPAGPVMGGLPRFVAVSGIEEHTAHHRGSLAVYSRLRGHVPPMPYSEM